MTATVLFLFIFYLASWEILAQTCHNRGYNNHDCHGIAPACNGKHANWPEDVTIFRGQKQVVEACDRHDGDDQKAHLEFPEDYRLMKEQLEKHSRELYFCDWTRYQFKLGIKPFIKNGECTEGKKCSSGKKRLSCYNHWSCNVDRCTEQQGDDESLAGRRVVGIHRGTRPPNGYGYSNARITQDLHHWPSFGKRPGWVNGLPVYCFCLYEKTFDSFEGSWDFLGITDHQGSFERTLTMGTAITNGDSLTQEYSQSISTSVSVGYKFLSGTVTGETSKTTSQMLSSSITVSFSESCTTSYPSPASLGFNYLHVYRFSMRGYDVDKKMMSETLSCSTFGLYSMTQAEYRPQCPLGDCKDTECQVCISGTDYRIEKKPVDYDLFRGGNSTYVYPDGYEDSLILFANDL